jgi:Ni/Fe-hydrogenase subunit HybB-like protein
LVVETSPFLLERLGARKLLSLARRVMLPVAILGVTLSSLHQSTLGTLYLNMPHRLHALWYTPILSLLFLVSSIVAGLSLAILAYVASTHIAGRPAKAEIVQGLGRGIAGVAIFYLALKLVDLALARELPQLFAFTQPALLMGLELGVGVVLPIILLVAPATRNRRLGQVGAPILFLFGVLLNRFNATMFAQALPPGVTYAPHLLEWLSTLGILAIALLAWWLGIRFLVIFDSREDH